ncbi:MAG: hypothetical protein ACRC6T_09955 [Sarcina sp.]
MAVSVLGTLKNNFSKLNDGLTFLLGHCNNILVRNEKKEAICSFYNSEDGEILIKKFLKEHNIDRNTCTFEEIKEAPDENIQRLLDYFRLTYLDQQLVLYKDILEISKIKILNKVDHIHKNKYSIEIYVTA